jgi:hypothetical protein
VFPIPNNIEIFLVLPKVIEPDVGEKLMSIGNVIVVKTAVSDNGTSIDEG